LSPFRVMLKYWFYTVFFLTTFLQAQSVTDFKWRAGEELVYNVEWEFVYLGTVTISNLGQEFVNGKNAYNIRVVIESNPLLFWLDNQSVYNTYLTDSLQVMRFVSDENVNDTTYNAQYDFDYQNKNIKLTLFNKKKQIQRVRNLPLKDNLIDGIGLIQFARVHSLEVKKDTAATFIEDKSGSVVFDFSLSKHITKTDAFPDGIKTVYFNGELFMKGIAGITGPFETWYSDDSSRVPILAYMEVFIGQVEIELVKWKNWSPHKLIVEKKD
jgi:Protein of unknown function (DUF3108)